MRTLSLIACLAAFVGCQEEPDVAVVGAAEEPVIEPAIAEPLDQAPEADVAVVEDGQAVPADTTENVVTADPEEEQPDVVVIGEPPPGANVPEVGDGVTVREATVRDVTVGDPTVQRVTVRQATVGEPTVRGVTVRTPTIGEPSVREPTVREPSVAEPTVRDVTVRDPTVRAR